MTVSENSQKGGGEMVNLLLDEDKEYPAGLTKLSYAYIYCPFAEEVLVFKIDENGRLVCPRSVDPATGKPCPMRGSRVCLHGR